MIQTVKLTLDKVLASQKKSKYALAKETGVSYATIHKMAKKEVKSVELDILQKICDNLNCDLTDIIPIKPH